MFNLLDKYLKDKNISSSQFSRMMKCSAAAVHTWRHGKSKPNPAYVWKIHKATKGMVPITYFGYAIINGKIRRLDNDPIDMQEK